MAKKTVSGAQQKPIAEGEHYPAYLQAAHAVGWELIRQLDLLSELGQEEKVELEAVLKSSPATDFANTSNFMKSAFYTALARYGPKYNLMLNFQGDRPLRLNFISAGGLYQAHKRHPSPPGTEADHADAERAPGSREIVGFDAYLAARRMIRLKEMPEAAKERLRDVLKNDGKDGTEYWETFDTRILQVIASGAGYWIDFRPCQSGLPAEIVKGAPPSWSALMDQPLWASELSRAPSPESRVHQELERIRSEEEAKAAEQRRAAEAPPLTDEQRAEYDRQRLEAKERFDRLRRRVYGTEEGVESQSSEPAPPAPREEIVASGQQDVAVMPHEPGMTPEFKKALLQQFPNLNEDQADEYIAEGRRRNDAARRALQYPEATAARPNTPILYQDRPPGMKLVEFLRTEYLAKGVLKRPGFTRLSIRTMDKPLYDAIKAFSKVNDLPADVNIPKARQRLGRRESGRAKSANPSLQKS